MQTTSWRYPAVFDREADGEIDVRFPDIPEVLTGAATLDEARALAADALDEAVLAYLADGRPVPAPSPVRGGQEAVALDPLTAGRAAVQLRMRALGISKVALAERMHKDEKVVRRILDGRGAVQMANVTQALRALGAEPVLSV
jgi:antitoxin HicB